MAIAPDGKIGWGAGNQVIRTRAQYAAAGFVTIVPDAAPDLAASNPKHAYRSGPQHGQDLGAVVAYARGLKTPVTVVGTSRGAVSAGALLAQSSGGGRPDALVLTAPMLMTYGDQASFQKSLNNSPAKAQLPFLVVGHQKDGCKYTAPASIEAFTKWHGGKVDVVMLDGPDGPGRSMRSTRRSRLRRHRRNRRVHRHQLDQGAQIDGFELRLAPPLATRLQSVRAGFTLS